VYPDLRSDARSAVAREIGPVKGVVKSCQYKDQQMQSENTIEAQRACRAKARASGLGNGPSTKTKTKAQAQGKTEPESKRAMIGVDRSLRWATFGLSVTA
jgi:hypothetical protein